MKKPQTKFLVVLFSAAVFAIPFATRSQDSTNATAALAQNSNTNAADTFKQYIADLQKNPGDDALREKIIKLAATMNPKPETPDEANRHFVKAATFLKEAKDKSDYQLAVNEYQQAQLLAPWWGAAYFNEGVALQSAGQFDQATAAFKLYLLTNPDDAADVKTRIYAMEAEKELAAKHAANEQAKVQEAAKAQEPSFAGKWSENINDRYFIEIFGSPGHYSAKTTVETFNVPIQGSGTMTAHCAVSDFRIQGRSVKLQVTVILPSFDPYIYDYDLALNEDGNKLVGTCMGTGVPQKSCEFFHRH